jgi:hypothetical protein
LQRFTVVVFNDNEPRAHFPDARHVTRPLDSYALTNPALKAYAESFGIQTLAPVRPVLECSMIIAT